MTQTYKFKTDLNRFLASLDPTTQIVSINSTVFPNIEWTVTLLVAKD